MQTRPLFLLISGSSGVLKAFLLERNRQLSCNPKKKKKSNNAASDRSCGEQRQTMPSSTTSKLQCHCLAQRNISHQHVSTELHKEIFAQATNTKSKQHLRDLSGVAKRQKTEFHGGAYKDLQRHAFSEVTVAAPLPAKTPAIPLKMSTEDG